MHSIILPITPVSYTHLDVYKRQEDHAEVHFAQHVRNHLFELQAENQISLMPTQG